VPRYRNGRSIAQAKYQQGPELLEKQQLAGALRLLGESLAQEETCERWQVCRRIGV